MKAVRIHEDGGPEVLRYEEVARSGRRAGRGARGATGGVAQPSRPLGAQGAPVGAEAAHPRRGRRRQSGSTTPASASSSTRGSSTAQDHGDRRAHRRHACRADRGRRRATSFRSTTGSVRDGRRLPARLRDRVPDARHRAQLRPGEWVLIWGIGGGVATAAFEIARAIGAKTLVTSGSDDKLERARDWGADLAVPHAEATSPLRRRRSAVSTSSSRPSARRPGRTRSLRSRPADASSSAAPRAARTRPRSCIASGGSS